MEKIKMPAIFDIEDVKNAMVYAMDNGLVFLDSKLQVDQLFKDWREEMFPLDAKLSNQCQEK